MTVPTGLGLVRGFEAADQPGGSTMNRPAMAAANNAKYDTYDQQPDPCYCGSCDMTRKPFK